jgi:hypothetical protein
MSESEYEAAAELLCRGLPAAPARRRRPGAALGMSFGQPAWMRPPVEARRKKSPEELAADYPARVAGALAAGKTPPRDPSVIAAEKNGYGAGPGVMQDAVAEYHQEMGTANPADVEKSRQDRLRRNDEPSRSPPGQGPTPGAGAVPGAGPGVYGVVKGNSVGAEGVLGDLLALRGIDLGAEPLTRDNFMARLYEALREMLHNGSLRPPAAPPPSAPPPAYDGTSRPL